MWRVLIVGGDGARAAALREGLRSQGCGVVCARSAALGVRLASNVDFAILALDPAGANGAELDLLLDRIDRRVPVMVVADQPPATAFTAPAAARPLERVAFDDIAVDFLHYRATKAGLAIDLSPREFELLRFLIERRDRVVTRKEMLDGVWGVHGSSFTRTVDVHIAKLRRKIADPPLAPKYILTVHRSGYRFIA
jgi:DNA-binding response OmpR family regulator